MTTSGAGTNFKVRGAPIRRSSEKTMFWLCPSTFWI